VPAENDNRINLPVDTIERYIARDIRRLERIEDKSKTNVFAAGIGVTLLTSVMALYANDRPFAQLGVTARYVSIVVFAVAIVSSFVSAIMSLRAYRVGMVNYPDLHDQPPLCAEQDTKRALLDCLDLNRLVIIQRANCLTVAMNLLVNAVIALALFVLFVVAAVTTCPNPDLRVTDSSAERTPSQQLLHNSLTLGNNGRNNRDIKVAKGSQGTDMDPNALVQRAQLSLFAEYKDLLMVLAGGLCAALGGALGGILTTWYRARTARRQKMEETIGAQKVDAYKKALRLASQLQSMLIQGTYGDVLGFIEEGNSWVIDNEILLPQVFAEYWHSVRANVLSAQRREQSQARLADGPERDTRIEELLQLEEFTRGLAKKAENTLRTELHLTPFKIHRPPKDAGIQGRPSD
jgi:hypothetical protein